jgi:hypothetical protein
MQSSSHLARFAIAALVTSVATIASAQVAEADRAPPALYQRFEIAKSGQWINVSVRLDHRAWRAHRPDGQPVTAAQWNAAIGGLKALVIGTHCAPVVRGATSYPCSFSLAKPALGNEAPADSAAQGWWATSDYTHRNFESQTVSAVSAPQPVALPTSLKVGTEFLGLIAPAAFRDRVATSKAQVLRFRVRCGASPAADAAAVVGHGLLILSPEALGSDGSETPVAPVSDRDRV